MDKCRRRILRLSHLFGLWCCNFHSFWLLKWIDISESARGDFCGILRGTYNVLLTQWVINPYCRHSGLSVTYEVQTLAFQVIASSLSTGLGFGPSFNVLHHRVMMRVRSDSSGRENFALVVSLQPHLLLSSLCPRFVFYSCNYAHCQ